MRMIGLVFALVVLCVAPTGAGDVRVGGLVIEAPWARATPGRAKNGVVYVSLANEGAAPDRLIAVTTPIARKASLHAHRMDKGIMKMRPIEGGIAVPPGETVALKPGGLHIMLMGLTQALKKGGSFPLILEFEGAGKVEITVPIMAIGAMKPGHHHGKMGGKSP